MQALRGVLFLLPGGEVVMSGNSKEVAAAALKMAISRSREEERVFKEMLREEGIQAAAVDFGGEMLQAVKTIIERAVVAAKREFLVGDSHAETTRSLTDGRAGYWSHRVTGHAGRRFWNGAR